MIVVDKEEQKLKKVAKSLNRQPVKVNIAKTCK
jgi:hypothetical protein